MKFFYVCLMLLIITQQHIYFIQYNSKKDVYKNISSNMQVHAVQAEITICMWLYAIQAETRF